MELYETNGEYFLFFPNLKKNKIKSIYGFIKLETIKIHHK